MTGPNGGLPCPIGNAGVDTPTTLRPTTGVTLAGRYSKMKPSKLISGRWGAMMNGRNMLHRIDWRRIAVALLWGLPLWFFHMSLTVKFGAPWLMLGVMCIMSGAKLGNNRQNKRRKTK